MNTNDSNNRRALLLEYVQVATSVPDVGQLSSEQRMRIETLQAELGGTPEELLAEASHALTAQTSH